MGKAKKIFTHPRVIILIMVIVLAIVAIHPNFLAKGAAIRNVIANSTASLAGIQSPTPAIPPMSRELIVSIDNIPISNVEDYYSVIGGLKPNMTINLKTNKQVYRLKTQEKFEIIELNETEIRVIEETIYFNATINGTTVTANKTISREAEVPKTKAISLGVEDTGIRVYDAPTTNLRKGLDLQGGTRVLLQPEEKLDEQELGILIDNMKERLNVYGLSDLIVREAGDLSGNQYILVEIPGVNEDDVKDLLSKQGKFEATIGNVTVFVGGRDIKYVCRSADCAGIDPRSGCGQSDSAWFCRFRFSITLSQEAAETQANLTKGLDIVPSDSGQQYLSEKLFLYLDDKPVDELNIGSDLKGKAVTDIEISGSGIGATKQEAALDALKNMKKLQTILITGSLPVKLNIIKTDSISPILGEEFVKNAIQIGLISILVVALVIFLRYRRLKVSIPIVTIASSEIVILLGFAAIANWSLDLSAIAGIIITIGTSVNDQIVIADEIIRGEKQEIIFSWKERIKRAFFIIMTAYATIVVAMLPLLFAGAGLLKGFALTTIFGISIGVFITRPTYSKIMEILLKE